MNASDSNPRQGPFWFSLSRSLVSRLIVLLLVVMVAVFSVLTYLNIRMQRQHLQSATQQSAELVSDAVKRSISYYMLQNDRQGLAHAFSSMADEPGIVRVRIFNPQGRVSFSTEAREVGTRVDQRAQACDVCHAHVPPLTRVDRPARFRIFPLASGERVLGIINPIDNQPACSSAACHAHPGSQRILGVLDTTLSLARADADLAESDRRIVIDTLAVILGIALLTGLFVWKVVGVPMRQLQDGTARLTQGDLGYQIEVSSEDEIGQLAASFNDMSRQLRAAREEITGWARTLETRVEEKTHELERAHERMLQVEKMASLGKLAATVAHEINNPLSGILTYAKLLKKWLDREERDASLRGEMQSSLNLIESESRRCGEIVRNLLMFARAAPMNLEWTNLNLVVERCARLVEHQAELANIHLQLDLDERLPQARCDSAQIEQLLLALVMNAVDALGEGGTIWIETLWRPAAAEIELRVRDDGPGIPPEILPHVFEPFFTTKEGGHSVGLGLAVSRSIVERHFGRIRAESNPGGGATFTVTLPADVNAVSAAAGPIEAASTVRR